MTDIIDKLSHSSRMWKTDVINIIASAPRRYKVYYIPKRNGEMRTIAHPSRELKALQRGLIKLAPENLLIHDCATAYEKGTSIFKNAVKHAGCTWLAKFDLSDFFNSINCLHWKDYLTKIECDADFSDISSQLFFWLADKRNVPCLSVGAPSSPFASNRFMYSFDNAISEYCSQNEMQFSRYADDIAISSKSSINIEELQKRIVFALPMEGALKLNHRKTILVGPGQRKSVTGLILSNDGKVTIGRKRKRKIEAMVHAYTYTKAMQSKEEIQGHLAFLRMVDVEGYNRIKTRFENQNDIFKQ